MRTLNRNEEERILKEVKANALRSCNSIVKEFADCATGRTLSVVWACRGIQRRLNDCLGQYTTQQALDDCKVKYLKEEEAGLSE